MKKLRFLIAMVTFATNIAFTQENIPSKLIGDFYQGQVEVSRNFQNCSRDNILGNCAAVALIKCAMAEFGTLQNIFLNLHLTDTIISATMMDNVNLQINKSDLELVKNKSGIKKSNFSVYYDSAIILYALMCQRIYETERETSNCIKTYENAVEHLNSGYNTPNVYRLLGLKKRNVARSEIKNHQSVVIWCGAHAAYSSMGIQDLLGQGTSIKGNKMRNLRRYSKISGAYVLLK